MTSKTPALPSTSSSIQSTTLSSSTAATILSAVSNIGLNANSGSRNQRAAIGKTRKRPNQSHPVSFSAIPNSFVDKNNDFIWYVVFMHKLF